MSAVFTKDPNAVLDYQVDWSTWLAADTIATSTWTAPTGIVVASSSNTTTAATVWLTGGTAGTTYSLVNRIVTAGLRTDDRTILVRVEEK